MKYVSKGYDRTQRCYHLENNNLNAGTIEFTLKGSKESPVINPAIMVKHWISNGARILINGKKSANCKVGINHELEGNDLVLFIPVSEIKPVRITILP